MEDCYIFIETEKDTNKEAIRILCVDCHAKLEKKIGWFYEGSLKGYGPWPFICGKCSHVIHDFKEPND